MSVSQLTWNRWQMQLVKVEICTKTHLIRRRPWKHRRDDLFTRATENITNILQPTRRIVNNTTITQGWHIVSSCHSYVPRPTCEWMALALGTRQSLPWSEMRSKTLTQFLQKPKHQRIGAITLVEESSRRSNPHHRFEPPVHQDEYPQLPTRVEEMTNHCRFLQSPVNIHRHISPAIEIWVTSDIKLTHLLRPNVSK